jgi:hypothetical protein
LTLQHPSPSLSCYQSPAHVCVRVCVCVRARAFGLAIQEVVTPSAARNVAVRTEVATTVRPLRMTAPS